tara:strand:- start:2143 stop:3144 length:1002 start_codon:yes stop_codon:yes gene_type:complete
MKEIVITGCAGLLGSHLTRHLLDKGYRVIGIDDLSGGYQDYLPTHENFSFHKINLSEKDSFKKIENLFCAYEPFACYHFAAYAAEGLSPFIRHFNYTNNILASVNVINTCINHDVKIIFTSSMATYGNQPVPYTEDMTLKPIDPYGIAKYTVEQDIKVAGDQHGLRYNIIRPHNVIGIYQNIWDKYRNVAGIFIRRVLAGEPMLIYGDGEQTRAFSDIKFYLEPFEKLINTNNGETFNIGADKVYSLNELADTVQRVALKNGFEADKKHVEGRHEVKHAHCDHAKAKEMLDFSDDTNLEETIDEMFKWAMTQPKREQKVMDYETTKGIYDYWK